MFVAISEVGWEGAGVFHLIYGVFRYSVSFMRYSAHRVIDKNNIYGLYVFIAISEVGWQGENIFHLIYGESHI